VSEAAGSAGLPGVPSLARLGFPSLDLQSWWMLLAPAGVPPEILERMHAALAGALGDAAMRARMAEHGIAALGAGPDAAAAFLTAEVERWGGLVRAFRITTAG
jgi:tripartite-type tricarboxylate transporter receptor subunit TctC